MRRQSLMWLLLTAAVLLSVLGKILLPEGIAWLRQEASRVLAADAENWQLLEVMGRALSTESLRAQLTEAILRQTGEQSA